MKLNKQSFIKFIEDELSQAGSEFSIKKDKYRRDAAKELKRQAKLAEAGEDFDPFVRLKQPHDETIELSQLLRLLKDAEKRTVFLTIDSQVIPLKF